jgi:hypothetical protein
METKLVVHGLLSSILLAVCALGPYAARAQMRVTSARTANFRYFGLAIRHPSSWVVYEYPEFSFSFTTLISYLSPLRLHDPCTATGGKLSCAPWPVVALPTRAVVVRWTTNGFQAGRRISGLPGRSVFVDRHRAKLYLTASTRSICPKESQFAVTLDIVRGAGNYLEMRACLRGPGIERMEGEVLAMVRSIRMRSAS